MRSSSGQQFLMQVLFFGLTCVAMSQSVGSPTDAVVHPLSQTDADWCGPSGCVHDKPLTADVEITDHSQLASDGSTSRGFPIIPLMIRLFNWGKHPRGKRSLLSSDYNDKEDEAVIDDYNSESRTFIEEQLRVKLAYIRYRLAKLKKQHPELFKSTISKLEGDSKQRHNVHSSRLPHPEDLENTGPLDLHLSNSAAMSTSPHFRVGRTPCIDLALLFDPEVTYLGRWYLANILNDGLLPNCQPKHQ